MENKIEKVNSLSYAKQGEMILDAHFTIEMILA